MSGANHPLAFWLVPAAREHEFFAELIENLANRFEAPVFEPHLTLHGGKIDHERALQMLRGLPASTSYELEIEGLHSSAKYTKTLFIRFRLSDEIRTLRSALAQALDFEGGDDFDPHLSLLYKEMAPGDQEELTRSIKIPFQRVVFAGLKLIAHPPTVTTRAEVEAWREIGERSLTSTSA